MVSTINNIYKCRRISYWTCEECAGGMESIEAWSQQMLKIKCMRHVAMRTVGLFFWWWTLEFSRAKGQLVQVNSYRFTSSQPWLRFFLFPSGETDLSFVGYLWPATVVQYTHKFWPLKIGRTAQLAVELTDLKWSDETKLLRSHGPRELRLILAYSL